MKIEILTIDRWMLDGKHRTSVIYLKDNIRYKVDFLSENELQRTEIINQINNYYEN